MLQDDSFLSRAVDPAFLKYLDFSFPCLYIVPVTICSIPVFPVVSLPGDLISQG